ncbi:hypothetical protein Tco_0758856, partial [Tanacetum coccineum]
FPLMLLGRELCERMQNTVFVKHDGETTSCVDVVSLGIPCTTHVANFVKYDGHVADIEDDVAARRVVETDCQVFNDYLRCKLRLHRFMPERCGFQMSMRIANEVGLKTTYFWCLQNAKEFIEV